MALNDAVSQSPEYQDIYSKIIGNVGPGVTWDAGNTKDALEKVGSQFSNLFKNSVGRDPTDDEFKKMFSEVGPQILQSPEGFSGVRSDSQGLRNKMAQYVGDTFQQAAQDTATQKTSDLSSKYGSLADQYMEMGKKSLGNLSDSLKSYSTSLFEKLRPQLNLAAQAGGYADSGGQTLQEKGALTDLANQGQGVLGQAAYDVENNANNIKYGGMAAPVSMASTFAANAPYAVQSLGAGGLGYNNSDSMANNDYRRQLGLMDYSGRINERTGENMAPSFGRTLSQSFANNFGASAGNQATKYGTQGLGALFGA